MHLVRTTLLSLCLLSSAAPAQNRSPPDVATPGPPDAAPPRFPRSTVGELLTRHLDSQVAVGEQAERDYQVSLRRLRGEPEAVGLLRDAYAREPESEYFARWQLVYTLASLEQREALSPLARIALSPLPAEQGESPEVSTVGLESNIRVAAVDGLAALARRGVPEAETVLRRLVTHPDLSIRQRAVRGYLAAGADYDARVKTLRAALPPSDHGLITLETTEVRRIPHPDDTPEDLGPRTREPRDTPTAR